MTPEQHDRQLVDIWEHWPDCERAEHMLRDSEFYQQVVLAYQHLHDLAEVRAHNLKITQELLRP